MPAYSKSRTQVKQIANIVRTSFPLPGRWIYQDITLNYSFQGIPTFTIKTEGITEEDFPAIKQAFKLASTTYFNGIPCEVSQISWSRQFYDYIGGAFNIYSISANFDPVIKRRLEKALKVKELGGTFGYDKKKPQNAQKPKISIQKLCHLAGIEYYGPQVLVPIPENREEEINVGSILPEIALSKGCYIKYGKGVELIPWRSPSAAHKIGIGDIIQDGENSETFPPTYEGVEITWDREDDEDDEDDEEEPNQKKDNSLPPRYDFVRAETKIQELTEEDVDYNEPPPDSKVLRTLDSASWNSGPTRKHSKVTFHDGTEIKSHLEIWGFIYRAFDIAKPDGLLFSSTPKDFWNKVEWQDTYKVYERLGLVSLRVNGINAANQQSVPLIMHPDFVNFAKLNDFASFGGIYTFEPQAEYLTEIVTTGAKIMPLEKEPGRNQSLDDVLNPDENERFAVQTPTLIPKLDRTAYKLGAERSYYKTDDPKLPFQIDFQDYGSLDDRLKETVQAKMGNGVKPNFIIGIVTPDINYVEPLVVLAESRTTNSFAYAADPESTDEDPIPPLVAGEEGYFKLERTIFPPDRFKQEKYREDITEYTATDPGFKASLTISRTVEKSGQAPAAESRAIKYEQKDNPAYLEKLKQLQQAAQTAQEKKKQKPVFKYYVNSDLRDEGNPSGGNLSFPYAKSLGEAMRAAKTAIEMEHCQNAGQHQKTIAWYLPDIRDGDRVTVGSEKFRVLSASVTVRQAGNNVRPIPGLVQLTDGTQVTLGPEVPRQVTNYRTNEAVDDDPMEEALNPDQGNPGDGKVVVDFIGGTAGTILEPDSSRRKF